MALLNIQKMKNERVRLVVDTSYLMHYKISSSMTKYGYDFSVSPCEKSEIGTYDWTTNEEYIEILRVTTINHIKRYCKNVGVLPKDIIFAIDCNKKNIWRRDIFPDYKQSRIDGQKKKEDDKESYNMGPVFGYFKRFILPELVETFKGSAIIDHPVCEGDDIISVSVATLKEEYPENPIVICANDSDLVQLCTGKVSIHDLKFNCVDEKVLKKFLLPENIVRCKSIMGDGKDNVDQPIPRCGLATAFKLLGDKQLLKEKIQSIPNQTVAGTIKHIQLNKALLDLFRIPLNIQDEVKDLLYARYFKRERVKSDLDGL